MHRLVTRIRRHPMSHRRTRFLAALVVAVVAAALLVAQPSTATASGARTCAARPGLAEPSACHTLTVEIVGTGLVMSTDSDQIVCGQGNEFYAGATACAGAFPEGAVQLAVPALPFSDPFMGWTGCDETNDYLGHPGCLVQLTSDRTVTARFGTAHTLGVQVVGDGTVSSEPPGINCSGDSRPRPGARPSPYAEGCSKDFADGDEVTLTATPADGQHFVGWTSPSGERPRRAGDPDCTGTDVECVLTMTADATVTATFAPDPSTHTLDVQVVGTGTVTSEPAGIDCGADVPSRPGRDDPAACSAEFDEDTPVTLTATPGVNQRFVGWFAPSVGRAHRDEPPSCTGSDPECTLTMTADATVVARFEPRVYILAVRVAGNGTVTSSPYTDIDCRTPGPGRVHTRASTGCATGYGPGTEITLTAEPDPGQRFAGWSAWSLARPRSAPDPVCTGTAPTCTFTMNQDVRVLATFEPAPPTVYYDMLRVTIAGDGGGTVTSDPAGIDCGTDCSDAFLQGSTVTLTAVPEPGSTFVGFTGADCTGSGATCTVTMSRPQRVTAEFIPTETPDTTPPQTVIRFGPRWPANDHSRFGFASDEPGSTFQCSMDGGPRRDCVSGVDYPCLAPGRHTFRVWATDPAGNTDPTPASRRFRVRGSAAC
jgi:hypothetical protein